MSQVVERCNEITPQELAHYEFITRTDRKSLRTQIKNLVQVAQEFSAENVNKRRNKLQKMLEYEDKIYEEEFASKVKIRIDEDIKIRKEQLFKIKEESTRNEQIFLQKKRMQQNIESCYEIREMMRTKDTQNIKETHLEQMIEKERNIARQRDLDKFWLNVAKINAERDIELQRKENCLKRENAMLNRRVIEVQLQEHAEKRERENAIKRQEEEEINKLINELRIEEFDQKHKRLSVKKLQYREELLKTIAERKKREFCQREEEAESHRQLIREIQAAEADAILKMGESKRATYKALVEFIKYAKRLRQLEEDQHKMRDGRLDELGLVDICTKRNMKATADLKAERAHDCYCALRRQICEVAERRMREEVERKENKMLENRFVHEEVPWEKIHAQRNKYREDLDKQIAELKRLRTEEDAKFRTMLMRATNDPVICDELAVQYFQEGTDFLEPHPNWRIFLCPKSKYDQRSEPKSVATPTNDGAGDQPGLSSCLECIGCTKKDKIQCEFKP